ncbi:MAG: glycosyltransferase [Holophagales bacterium]|nr:glycosyltransferase [Holophagales bacterium]
MSAVVTVAIVTHDDADDLPGCLAAVARQTLRPLEVVVADCASRDGSPAAARRHAPAGIPTRVLELGENRGFAGGMNAAFGAGEAPWFLTLNADAELAPDYLERLLARLAASTGARPGAATGRLVRPGEPPVVDACGFRLTRTWRHLDRGSGEPDRGQLARAERVFGGTGAATLWSRAAVEDAALAPGELFDPRFHTYREDAELCFRLAERGWAVLYEPAARALHRRRVLPERRRALPDLVNLNSLRNRYLLRIYHQTAANFWRTLPWTAVRDLGALAWVVARERGSLAAYRWLWRERRALWERRRRIQERRSAPADELERWFRVDSLPLAEEAR